MGDWYPVRLAPQDGTPVNLWIEDQEAPPTYPVTVGVWETDDITRRSHWRLWRPLRHPHLLRPACRRLAPAASRPSCPKLVADPSELCLQLLLAGYQAIMVLQQLGNRQLGQGGWLNLLAHLLC